MKKYESTLSAAFLLSHYHIQTHRGGCVKQKEAKNGRKQMISDQYKLRGALGMMYNERKLSLCHYLTRFKWKQLSSTYKPHNLNFLKVTKNDEAAAGSRRLRSWKRAEREKAEPEKSPKWLMNLKTSVLCSRITSSPTIPSDTAGTFHLHPGMKALFSAFIPVSSPKAWTCTLPSRYFNGNLCD